VTFHIISVKVFQTIQTHISCIFILQLSKSLEKNRWQMLLE